MTITADQIVAWIERYSNRIAEEKELLTKLDSDIGDADHGNNMNRGFQAVLAKKAELQGTEDIGALLKIVAMTLISTVGGAAGALYGTFFLQASNVTAGKNQSSHQKNSYSYWRKVWPALCCEARRPLATKPWSMHFIPL